MGIIDDADHVFVHKNAPFRRFGCVFENHPPSRSLTLPSRSPHAQDPRPKIRMGSNPTGGIFESGQKNVKKNAVAFTPSGVLLVIRLINEYAWAFRRLNLPEF